MPALRLGALTKALRLGALTKNLDNEFFLTMISGYERAAADMGIEIVVGSTPNENSEAEQLAVLEGWLNEGNFNGFAVTPFRATSLNSGLQQATAAGLPIVNLDELIPADAREGISLSAQVASDNVRAGQNAANWVIANVAAGSEVAVIEGAPGTSSSIDRVSGFTEGVTAAAYSVVASQTANWDRAEAFNVASNILQGPSTSLATSFRATPTSRPSLPQTTAWASVQWKPSKPLVSPDRSSS